jgi:hypothetical protein
VTGGDRSAGRWWAPRRACQATHARHTTARTATAHAQLCAMFKLRCRHLQITKVIGVMWATDVSPAATGYSAHDVISGIESGVCGLAVCVVWLHSTALGVRE